MLWNGCKELRQGYEMTFEGLDARYPNGFDDAKLEATRVDHAAGVAELLLSMRMGPPGDGVYSRGALRLSGLHYLVVEAPDGVERLSGTPRGLTIVSRRM
jgi:hypothetical protein